MKIFIKIGSFILVLFLLILPFLVSADLITCGGPTQGEKACDFNSFIGTLNGIIDWIISIAFVIFALSFIWGGYLYLTSGVKPANKDKAKTVLWSTFIGFVIILVAWLIVHTLLVYLVDKSGASDSIFNFIGGRK